MKEILDKILNFSINLDENLMIEIFGERIGKHLWGKFHYIHHNDFISWYAYLDYENTMKICEYIENH